jgi:hypothetical protein
MSVDSTIKTFTMPQILDFIQHELEHADDISLLICYEYLFNKDMSGVELFDEDFDNMFLELQNSISFDVIFGELTLLMDAISILTDLTFHKVFIDNDDFKFEFKMVK